MQQKAIGRTLIEELAFPFVIVGDFQLCPVRKFVAVAFASGELSEQNPPVLKPFERRFVHVVIETVFSKVGNAFVHNREGEHRVAHEVNDGCDEVGQVKVPHGDHFLFHVRLIRWG